MNEDLLKIRQGLELINEGCSNLKNKYSYFSEGRLWRVVSHERSIENVIGYIEDTVNTCKLKESALSKLTKEEIEALNI